MDSILTIDLKEVIVISSFKRSIEHKSQPNPLSTLDEYLESSKKISMVKRGAYAWDPMLNDMTSERLSITIDGMRIFGACTDKMDPITSYVDVSNLSDVQVKSGQQGAQHGNVIGGAIDMRLEKSNFKPLGWTAAVETGYETNNTSQIVGGELNYSDENFYLDTDIIYRKAENYTAGGGEEVAFSQYEKYNLSANAGYKVSDDQKLLASFIFDEARDVGYPALPMDVSLARAFIGSLSWVQSNFIGNLENWESKLYANTITHIMDDSQRPDVPIRMDMPGWSDTYGFYSQTELSFDNHRFIGKIDGFYNRSLAEMTMYPNNPNEQEMFMLTWPDVRTFNTGLYLEDKINLSDGILKLATRLAYQSFHVADDFGLNSLRIFYPDMDQRQTRTLKSVSAHYHKQFKKWHVNGGVAYGDRAPSVSEGFGFYLFNSFDNHDYIGNPNLKNEKALETRIKVTLPLDNLELGLEGNYFHTRDYIIGEIDPTLNEMTIGADGVKIYTNLKQANLYNVSMDMEYKFTPELNWSGRVSYHRGIDHNGRNLPFISPVDYRSQLSYAHGSFSGSVTLSGAMDQTNFSPTFGEDRTPAYTLLSLSLGKTFSLGGNTLYVKAGVENLFDTYYSTYSDWNNIPRMGRNFFMTLSYAIN
ncbi:MULTISPECIES: TonB-dependent receptor [Flavobacteriaceae]|uniref:TonB-dependent receptor n=1 Tax=Flavobacteriaceae TaxID=49546 RepID=UPI00234A2AB0|nr:TonB-dependent receptor [Muricauda sp. SP22]MDC6362889.1 TonB-dependent receptor [Muricauda sp. SP22]